MRTRSSLPGSALACGAAVGLVLILAIADFQHAVDQVPTLPEPCPGCDVEARNAAVSERLDRLLELEDEYERRLTGYSVAVLLIGIGFLVMRLRGLPSGKERDAFTELGIGGVVWLIVVVLLGFVTSDVGDPLEPSIGVPLAVGGALLLVAAVGSLATWSRPAGGVRQAASGLPVTVLLGAALALLSVIASTVGLDGRGDCEATRPEWLDTAFTIAFALAAGASLCGLVALFQRRWFAALLLVAVAPCWAILAAVGAACLS